MSTTDLKNAVDAAWEVRDEITPQTKGVHRDAIEKALTLLILDMHAWLKKETVAGR